MSQFWFDSLAFFVFNNNICKHNAYKMRIYKVLEPTFNHSHSSFSSVHHIPKCSNFMLFVLYVLGKSSNFGLFLDFFARSSTSSNFRSINDMPFKKYPTFFIN